MTAPARERPVIALTEGSGQALVLGARSHSNAEIASRPFVSLDTVKTMLKDTDAALGAKAKANAVTLGFVHAFITDAGIVR